MRWRLNTKGGCLLAVVGLMLTCPPDTDAKIDGISGAIATDGSGAKEFFFTARDGWIYGGDGLTIYTWGYSDNTGLNDMQYPGPTLIINQGDTVRVYLTNALPAVFMENVSIVFPGVGAVSASGGVAGPLTREAPPDGTTVVMYQFTAADAGTYHYHSGTRPDLQVEMGLVGAIVVRPTGFDHMMPTVYGDDASAYDREFLFLLTEMDLTIHQLMEFWPWGLPLPVDTTTFSPVYWFINGRNAPDTMLDAWPGTPWFTNQPYNCMPRMHPGEKVLLRIIGGGRDGHPFHPHGNNVTVIGRDGRPLNNLAYSDFTVGCFPGQTYDAIFEWSGKGLGWDIYGTGPGYEHVCTDTDGDDFDDVTSEYCPDHGKEFPVLLPDNKALTVGAMYSGSPFLGAMGALPPGEGSLNMFGGFTYMWHSHNEKEMVNNDIFPGGLMTMLIIESPAVPIDEGMPMP